MNWALFSLTDKIGSEIFAQFLVERGWRIMSTGGTAEYLRKHDIRVRDVADITGMPEGMGGRLKTLHPRICGGILGRPDIEEDKVFMDEQKIMPIRLVAVNLYAFEKKAEGCTDPKDLGARESIDIGGPTLLRAAAKNFEHVIVLTDPDDYSIVMDEIERKGDVSPEKRLELAAGAFKTTAVYDTAIATYMRSRRM